MGILLFLPVQVLPFLATIGQQWKTVLSVFGLLELVVESLLTRHGGSDYKPNTHDIHSREAGFHAYNRNRTQ